MGLNCGGSGRFVCAGLVMCLSQVTSVAWAKESVSYDNESKVDAPEKTDAELMYDAMKRSGQGSNNDAAIDRAIARAEKDSEKERKTLRQQGLAARTWKDPFVDDAAVVVRSRKTARNDAEALRMARAEASRAHRATAMARAEAALARAETARARADAARAEAVAARADAVAARQACVALPARDDGNRQASLRRSYPVHVATKRYTGTARSMSPSEMAPRPVTRAALTVSTREDSAPTVVASAPRPMSGIIVVPIPPSDAH
jgi:hypothetical protein